MQENTIMKLSFEFAVGIIHYADKLEVARKYTLARQLLRSGTSIGANVREAQNAESKADFVHKLKVALKEADETEYWLQLCRATTPSPDCEQLLAEIKSLQKVLNKIIATTVRLYLTKK